MRWEKRIVAEIYGGLSVVFAARCMKIGFIAESRNSDERDGIFEPLKYLRSHKHVKKEH